MRFLYRRSDHRNFWRSLAILAPAKSSTHDITSSKHVAHLGPYIKGTSGNTPRPTGVTFKPSEDPRTAHGLPGPPRRRHRGEGTNQRRARPLALVGRQRRSQRLCLSGEEALAVERPSTCSRASGSVLPSASLQRPTSLTLGWAMANPTSPALVDMDSAEAFEVRRPSPSLSTLPIPPLARRRRPLHVRLRHRGGR